MGGRGELEQSFIILNLQDVNKDKLTANFGQIKYLLYLNTF